MGRGQETETTDSKAILYGPVSARIQREELKPDGVVEYYDAYNNLCKVTVPEHSQYILENGNGLYEPCTAYLQDGNLHREDGPAVIEDDGTQLWFQFGELHRQEGPAIKFSSGEKEYWLRGQKHREGGPAIEIEDRKEWYRHGKLHREDGLAVEFADGGGQYWLNGVRFNETRWRKDCLRMVNPSPKLLNR